MFISAKNAGAWDSTLVEATTVADELSEQNKNKVDKTEVTELENKLGNVMGFPNYASVQAISNNYTVLENGFISVKTETSDTSAADRKVEVFINNTTVYKLEYGLSATTWWNSYPSLLPVKKGDIVKYIVTNSKVNLYFLPCRY